MAREIDIAWAAGVIEGEGTFGISNEHVLSVTVRMTDKDVVERLHSILGGRFYGPYKEVSRNKPIYTWALRRREELIPVLREILPFMGDRRTARIMELLDSNNRFPKGRERIDAARHGTISMYSNKNRCRCDNCVEAWREYQRNYRKRIRDEEQCNRLLLR